MFESLKLGLKPFQMMGDHGRRNSSNWGGKTPVNITKKKEEYLNMTVSEKRPKYACGKGYKTIEDVGSWSYYLRKISTQNFNSSEGSIYKSDPNLNKKIGLFNGNITALEIDAIVNAANRALLGGGGVDAAIHKAAGSLLLEECKTLGGCETGEAKITCGYNLPAKYVIHTVGPVGEKPLLLENCYVNSLKLAVENKVRTVAFPCVSTGVYGYPNEGAAAVVLQSVRTFLESHKDDLDLVIFCLFLGVDEKIYHKLLPTYFP